MKKILFLWDNFGPLHIDRIEAVAHRFEGRREVVGLELCGNSDTYDWKSGTAGTFQRETIFPRSDLASLGAWQTFRGITRAARRHPGAVFFFSHWNEPGVFLAASWLRLTGRRVFTMGCSKFDDKPRRAFREWLKSWMYLPYAGALGSGRRSIDYFRFLGFRRRPVAGEFNTVSLDRIRRQAGLAPYAQADVAEGPAFETRDFICVARLVEKKNLFRLIEAYALYAEAAEHPRKLHLCGSGPLQEALEQAAAARGVTEGVVFHGFVQSEAVSQLLASSLALLLPSCEEQFGNVVPEAQAMGLPVIISDNAGARDLLVRNALNGFVVEPDNPAGMAWFMARLSGDAALWRQLRTGAFDTAPQGDVARFAEGVDSLLNSARKAR